MRARAALHALALATLLAGCAVPPAAPPAAPPMAPQVAPSAAASTTTQPGETRPVAAVVAPTAAAETRRDDALIQGFAVDPERPTQPYDFDASSVRADLWARVRTGFAVPDLNNDLVVKWEQWYAGRPDYVRRMTERGSRYLFHVVEEIDKRGMPTELALLPFIESAFNPQAMSSARASGMWQFMPATGKDYDLKQNVFRDDRRDVLQSTRAALDYLQRLQRQFGDWQLALAAYNWGQGNVQRAIERNLKAGLPGTYEALRMPDETRNYVPKLQAVKNIVSRPQSFGLALQKLENHPYFLGVPITRDIDVDVAARLAGVSLEEFQQLNPQMNKPVILAAGTPQVLLPFDNAHRFVNNLRAHRGSLASWTAWVAPKTVKPADAARQLGMSEAELRAVNHIPAGMLVKGGSTLLVHRDAQRSADVPERVADNAAMLLAPERSNLKRVSFKAGKGGDSVAAVAARYRVGANQVAEWNGVAAGAKFKPGQTIVVMKPAATKVAARGDTTTSGKRGTTSRKATASPPAGKRVASL